MKRSKLVFNYVDCEFEKSGEHLSIPGSLDMDINKYWSNLMDQGKTFTNGELFTVNNIKKESMKLCFEMSLSSYAHYLYSFSNSDNCSIPCKSVAVNGLLETVDGYFVLGMMASKTSLPNKVKFVGGAIEEVDCYGGQFNLKKGLLRELEEEMGLTKVLIDEATPIKPIFILTSGLMNFFNVLHYIKLNVDKEELYNLFLKYNNIQKEIDRQELDDLVFLKNDVHNLRIFAARQSFSTVPYLYETFKVLSGDVIAGDLINTLFDD